jgi:hypothetical protein
MGDWNQLDGKVMIEDGGTVRDGHGSHALSLDDTD